MDRRSTLHTFVGLSLAAIGGLLLALAFPPYDQWPLIFVGFVPVIVAQHRIVPPRLSGLAYGVGFGSFYWGYFGPLFAGLPSIMAYVPLIAAVIATLASGGNRAFHERTGYRWFVLEGATAWVAIEAIRAIAPIIGTGGSVAYALYSQPWLIQPVGVFGIWGLGLVIMLLNYGVALALLALIDRRGTPGADKPRLRSSLAIGWLATGLLLLVAWSAGSVATGSHAQAGGTVRVAAIQPDRSASAAGLIALSRSAATQGAQLIVWPEGALGIDPRRSQPDRFSALARETGAYIVIGYGYRTAAGIVNEALVVRPDGSFGAPYGKDHPVVWMGETSLTRGAYPTYRASFGTLGMIICYDLNFTDTARRIAGQGARLIAVPSNDWPAMAASQYTNLVLRAVENRVALIKADTAYDSAIIAPDGRIVARQVTPHGAQAVLVADVPLGSADAPLIRLGDWIGWLCIAAFTAFTIAGPISARRARTRPRAATPAPLAHT